jgi:hypothetical protein
MPGTRVPVQRLGPRGAPLRQRVDLVPLEGEQRRDHHRRPVQEQGGQLVDRRLAGAAVQQGAHRSQLLVGQLGPAEPLGGQPAQPGLR